MFLGCCERADAGGSHLDEAAESITLKNKVVVEIHTASFRSTRGYTIVAALLDEIAYWPAEDAAQPDVEVINAIRPGMATIPGAMLLCASSPHARRGALWDAHRRHYGQDGDEVLVWQADTRSMNAVVPQSYIDRHVAEDPARAAAEYGAQFRVDIETYISREVIDAAVVVGRRELPRIEGVRYVGFVDPSGGSADSMTLAICHIEGSASGASRVVLDVVREVKPPFSPDNVVREFCALLKAYGVTTVRGDRYAGEWPRERFAVHGVDYVSAAKPKSDIYRDLLPVLNSSRAELLDHPRLVAQLLGLERSTARGGRDSIDHAPGAHDDVANCVAGALVTALLAATLEVPIVSPVLVHAGVRSVPGGVLGAGVVAAAPVAAADMNPMLKANQPREEWRDYVEGNYASGRNVHGVPRGW